MNKWMKRRIERSRARCERSEINKLTAEAEYRHIEHIIKLHDCMEMDSIRQRKITGDVEIEEKLARTLTGITWQISRLADSWQGKQVCDSRFGSVWTSPVQKTGI